jgi:hypothetical protein
VEQLTAVLVLARLPRHWEIEPTDHESEGRIARWQARARARTTETEMNITERRDRAAEAAAQRAEAGAMAARAAPSVTGDVLAAAYMLAVLIPLAGLGAGIIVGFRRPGHGLGMLALSCIAAAIEALVIVAVAYNGAT